ncbi:hypothetical protein [Nocardiopsis rhodophaea]
MAFHYPPTWPLPLSGLSCLPPLVDSLARGWHLKELHPFTEGELPRRLWRVTMVKGTAAEE